MINLKRMLATLRHRSKDFLAALPFGLETALYLREAAVSLPENLRPGKTFLSWVEELERSDGALAGLEALGGKRLLFFSYKPEWMGISLATALTLAARRCEVDFVFLPHSRCDREDSTAEKKYFQVLTGRFLKGSPFPRLRLVDLTRVCETPIPEGLHEGLRAQGLLDTKYVLKCEEIELEGNPSHREVFEFRMKRNLTCVARLLSLIGRNPYDLLITPNGGSMEWGAAFRLARHLGLPVVTFEFGDHLPSIWISKNIPSSSIDTSSVWHEDAPHTLLPEEREKVAQIALARQGVEWKEFAWAPQNAPRQSDRRKLLERLGIGQDLRPIVLMTTNIPWDSAMLGHDTVFPSLAQWVRSTVSYFCRRRDSWLIVRVHPGERIIGTGQPVFEIIRQHIPNLPSHIRLLGPEEAINTYDLMGLAHCGVVYTSITGMEMAMRGIPVVVAARPHYGGKGFTRDAKSQEDYFEAIDEMLRSLPKPRLSHRERELAWSYAHVFYSSWGKPFPWHRSTFWEDLKRWPITRVLSEEGESSFGRSFDILVDRAPSSGEHTMTGEVAG